MIAVAAHVKIDDCAAVPDVLVLKEGLRKSLLADVVQWLPTRLGLSSLIEGVTTGQF